MTVAELRKRLVRLEAKTGRRVITFKMPNGSLRTLSHTRVLAVFAESFADNGVKDADYQTIVTSVANNADHKLIELFKMCVE